MTQSDADPDASFADPAAGVTDREWQRVLDACACRRHIGFGLLDSFLSGPDLHRRLGLVEAEAMRNAWLRAELRDTLSLDRTGNLTPLQVQRLLDAAGGSGTGESG
jgi:hypothetical protein